MLTVFFYIFDSLRKPPNQQGPHLTLNNEEDIWEKTDERFIPQGSQGLPNILVYSIFHIVFIIITGIIVFILSRKLLAKLHLIEQKLCIFSDNSEQFAGVLNRIKNNVYSHQNDKKYFGHKFQTAEEKVARSMNAAVTILDLKGEQNFEFLHDVLKNIKASADSQQAETRAKVDEIINVLKSFKDDFYKKIHRLEIAVAKSTVRTQGTIRGNSDRYPDNAIRLERCIASAVKKNITIVQNKELENFLDRRLKEELRVMENKINEEIYKSSFALKQVVEDGSRINAGLCQNLMKYLTEISEKTLRKFLTTTDQIKYCLSYLHENQIACSREVVTKLEKAFNETHPPTRRTKR